MTGNRGEVFGDPYCGSGDLIVCICQNSRVVYTKKMEDVNVCKLYANKPDFKKRASCWENGLQSKVITGSTLLP